MSASLAKQLESTGKKMLRRIVPALLPPRNDACPDKRQIKKILIFRLDQRIGNGILLIPLIRAIRKSLPYAEIHVLIHKSVARLFYDTLGDILSRIWPYDQKYFLSHPLKFRKLLNRFRAEQFDVILSCHNPDNFSLSQGIMGRWCKPGCLVGFHWNGAERYYDVSVPSSPDKHYAESLLDLWRYFEPKAKLKWEPLEIPQSVLQEVKKRYPQISENSILFWVGATPGKHIPTVVISYIFNLIKSMSHCQMVFAAGPADYEMVRHYPKWIRNQILFLDRSLTETGAFLTQFRLVISGDTGPRHLAFALNVPTLAIFKKTNPVQYGYEDGENHFTVVYRNDPQVMQHIRLIVYHFAKRYKLYA